MLVFGQVDIQVGRQRDVQVVVVLCLDVVHGIGSLQVGLLVGIIEFVEVDLAVSLIA